MRRVFLLGLLVVPLAALALEYTDISSQYADAPFVRPEAAAISVLTHLKAVQGNPDGTFQPWRAVNRAEFLKIAFASHADVAVTPSDASTCFPDVRKREWFSRYVCLAKRRGAVKGYPDGRFHPENPVNYAEGLKMVTELFAGHEPWTPECVAEDAFAGCTEWREVTYPADVPWYQPYAGWAGKEKLLLPLSLLFDSPLTRGQAARLVASFRASADHELDLYRQAERGPFPRRFSSSISSSLLSPSSLDASSSSSIVSNSSNSSVFSLYPARSHQLLAGQLTPVLISGIFTSPSQDAYLRTVSLTLKREIGSIEKMFLVDENGKDIGELVLDIYDNTAKKRWVRDFTGLGAYILPADKPVNFGVRVLLKDRGEGGGAGDVFEADNSESFWIYMEGVFTQERRQLSPLSQALPISETVVARLEGVRSTLPPAGTLLAGKNRLVGSFSFTGTVLPEAILQLKELMFHLSAQNISVAHWHIGGPGELEQQPCGTDAGSPTLINCSMIPEGFKDITAGYPIGLYADIAVTEGMSSPVLQVSFTEHGAIGIVNRTGDIFWSDGTRTYRWMEEWAPLAEGPRWTVK